MADRLPAYLDDLQALVSIDSGTDDKAGVDRVADFLAARYRRLGAAVERHSHDVYGDTIVARFGEGAPHTVLLGHTDTVYPAGTASSRAPRREGDRLVGPGTADMKGGDLAILYAMTDLIEAGAETGCVTVIHNGDEEVGSPTSRDLIRKIAGQADAVLVLEPGRENGDIVSARKGIARAAVTVRGVAAHAGVNHDRGRSAVLELAHLVVRLEALNGTIPGVTLNVGPVTGGDRTNVVPDRASAQLEIRAFDRDHLLDAVQRVQDIVAVRTVADTAADVTVAIEHWPMQRSPGSAHLVDLARRLAEELGISLRDAATGGASDGNTAAQAGVPVLDGLGPVGGAAHSPGEYIEIPSVSPRIALLEGLIARERLIPSL